MTARPVPTGIEPGLMARFRIAGGQITWRTASSKRPANSKGKGAGGRIAHLHDEESRVEERTAGTSIVLVVESGPVGAIVVVLALDVRGLPNRLVTHEAAALPGFPNGAIEARWDAGSAERSLALSV
ncbi:MAG: hypothetical protein ACHQ16_04450, partial [Candidatus Lutacidiplasmatales archaeon]